MISIFRNFYFLFVVGIVFAMAYAYVWIVVYNDYSIIGFKTAIKDVGLEFYYLTIPMVSIWAIFVGFSKQHKKSDYGNAKWADTKDIDKMGLFSEVGIIYGIWHNKFIRTNAPLSVLVAAPPGTGKTVAVAIPNLLSCSNSMIVNDPKNELFEKTNEFRSRHQKVLRFAPAEKGSAKFDPFSEIPDDEIEAYTFIDRMAGILYPTENIDSKEIHFRAQAAMLFKTFVFQILLYKIKGFDLTLANVRKAILSGSYIDEERPADLQEGLIYDKTFLKVSGASGIMFERFLENSNLIIGTSTAEFGSTRTTCINALSSFDNPTIAENTSSSDFKLSDFRQKKITIYLSSRPKDLKITKPIMNMLVELFAIEILSDSPKDDQQVTLLLDEFPKMGKMTELIKLPAVSRGQKANVIFICQDFDQIKEVYKETGLNEIISTTYAKIIFTQNNYNTMERVSKLVGKKTEDKVSRSNQHGQFIGSKSNQVSQEGKSLVLPENVGTLKPNEVIIIIQGFNTTPILAKSARYFKVREFKKRCG